MNKHSYLSTRLVDLNNKKMYTGKHYGEYERAWAAGNMNVHELFYLIGDIWMCCFLT